MPLCFLAVAAWTFRSGEWRGRPFTRGLLFGIPAVLVWLLFRPLLEPAWGSPLLVLSFFCRYWLLPFGLSTAAYSVSVGFSGLARGLEYERLVSFMAGALSVFGLAHTVSSWGGASRVFALLLPAMLAASAVAYPVLLEEAVKDGMPGAVKYLALAVGGFALGALGVALFFMRLEWLGAILSALYVAGATVLGVRRLKRDRR